MSMQSPDSKRQIKEGKKNPDSQLQNKERQRNRQYFQAQQNANKFLDHFFFTLLYRKNKTNIQKQQQQIQQSNLPKNQQQIPQQKQQEVKPKEKPKMEEKPKPDEKPKAKEIQKIDEKPKPDEKSKIEEKSKIDKNEQKRENLNYKQIALNLNEFFKLNNRRIRVNERDVVNMLKTRGIQPGKDKGDVQFSFTEIKGVFEKLVDQQFVISWKDYIIPIEINANQQKSRKKRQKQTQVKYRKII